MKLRTRVCLKPSNYRGELELDRARSKNNIAKNSVALGHERTIGIFTVHYFINFFSNIHDNVMFYCTERVGQADP